MNICHDINFLEQESYLYIKLKPSTPIFIKQAILSLWASAYLSYYGNNHNNILHGIFKERRPNS